MALTRGVSCEGRSVTMKFTRYATIVAAVLALESCDQISAEERMTGWAASSAALGPLNAQTAFNLEGLQESLPAFQISEERAYGEGTAYPIFVARHGGDPDPVISIHGSGDLLSMVFIHRNDYIANAQRIGEHVQDTSLTSATCYAGMEERSGDVVCQDPDEPSLHYWISVDYSGPDGQLPPQDTIANGMIYEITWQPGH